jgi:hypothetical protein
MPRLSLWRTEKSADYKFFDRTIKEQFTIGATDLFVHKYLGTNNPTSTTDATLPHYDKIDPTNIQDLLFLENRDRKYDDNIYRIRGHYNVQNLDFNLSQFGLFLSNDIIFVTVHYNEMIDIFGRKLMVGDVFELPHLTDYHPLNETIPVGLRRYYQITDANFASEGFSSTWYPHLWRIKCEPLVDSQEFSDILKKPISKDNYLGDWDPNKSYPKGYTVSYNGKTYITTDDTPAGVLPTDTNYWDSNAGADLVDIISQYNANIAINNAALQEAANRVPLTGYDTSQLYVVPTLDDGSPGNPVDIVFNTELAEVDYKIETMVNTDYKYSSNVVRIVSSSGFIKTTSLTAGTPVLLSMGQTAPELTESGSGAVVGNNVITATMLPPRVSSPYGTADNMYAIADQSVMLTIYTGSAASAPRTSIIQLKEIPEDLVIGLKIRSTVVDEYGIPATGFDEDTTIMDIDPIGKTIQISLPSLVSLPEFHPIEVSYDFTGSVSMDMTYRADADPKYQYIKRATPRSFGYLVGYMTGDGTAPNGEPVGSGIAFPTNPTVGDYFLRLDYMPQKLFRWDGRIWVGISSKVRTEPGMTANDKSLRSSFFNNTDTIKNALGETVSARQGLSKALKINPD